MKFYPMFYFSFFKQMNCIIYSQLSMATVGGTYHNLVNKFKYTNIGNAAWKSMCECYDGDEIINVTEDLPRSNLKTIALYCHQIQDII